MAYIIGAYNKYDVFDRQHSIYRFKINDNWYAIKSVELEWGLPQVGFRADQEEYPESYYIYDTYEEAIEFVRRIKQMNAR